MKALRRTIDLGVRKPIPTGCLRPDETAESPGCLPLAVHLALIYRDAARYGHSSLNASSSR